MSARRLVHQTGTYEHKLAQYKTPDADLAQLGRIRPAPAAPATWRMTAAELHGYTDKFTAAGLQSAYDDAAA